MAKIAILGSGNFGTALAHIFSEHNTIQIYSIDKRAIDDIQKYRENRAYLPGIKLRDSITISDNLADIQECDIWVYAVPSSVYASVTKKVKKYYTNQIIVSASKGIDEKGRVLTEIIKDYLKNCDDSILAISGPSIASEMAAGKPTQVILGGERHATQKVKDTLKSEHFFIRCSRDRDGIQLLGFYKNIVSMLVGLCDGLDLGNNFKSALVAKAYSEFYYLNESKRIRRHSFIDYAGLGDLYVTSTSTSSRNRTFGYLLAKATSLDAIKKKIGQVIEGYENLLRLDTIDSDDWFDRNLVKTLLKIIKAKNPSEKKHLLLRYLKASEIKALVFDWGGVLTKDYYSMAVASALHKEYKSVAAKKGLKNFTAKNILHILEKNEKNLLLGRDSFNKYFNKVKKTYSFLTYSYFRKAYLENIHWNESMIKYVCSLQKDFKLYVVSNNYDILMPQIKRKLKCCFDEMIFSNEIHKLKPHDAIFGEILKRHGLRPENCIFIDDSKENISAAERNKFNVIEFENIIQVKKTMNEMIIR